MSRGGKREGAGRKAVGITKKVSLTLSDELWEEINEFDGTVADYIRSLKEVTEINEMKSVIEINEMKEVTGIKGVEMLKRAYFEEGWNTFIQDYHKKVTNDVLDRAYQVFIDRMLNGKKIAQFEMKPFYRSPFTDKFVKSPWDIIKNAVPRCIQIAQEQIKFQESMKIKEEDEKAEKERQKSLRERYPENYKV